MGAAWICWGSGAGRDLAAFIHWVNIAMQEIRMVILYTLLPKQVIYPVLEP